MRTIESFRRIRKYHRMIWKCRDVNRSLMIDKRMAEEQLRIQEAWLDIMREKGVPYSEEIIDNAAELERISETIYDNGNLEKLIKLIKRNIKRNNAVKRDLTSVLEQYTPQLG